MKISNMDGDWQKKNPREFMKNASHQFTTGSGAYQVKFYIQDALFSLPLSFQKINI